MGDLFLQAARQLQTTTKDYGEFLQKLTTLATEKGCTDQLEGVILQISQDQYLPPVLKPDGCKAPDCVPKSSLPEPVIARGCFVTFHQPEAPVRPRPDPFLLELKGIKPGSGLWVRVRDPRGLDEFVPFDVNDPDANRGNGWVELVDADTTRFATDQGGYAAVIGDDRLGSDLAALHRPGAVIEVAQVYDGEATVSAPQPTNRSGPDRQPFNLLYPAQVIGNAQPGPFIEKEPDRAPPAVNPQNVIPGFGDGQAFTVLNHPGKRSTEEFAQVVLENKATGEKTEVMNLETNPGKLGIAAQKGEPIVVHIFDHNNVLDGDKLPRDPSRARRLTFIAGETAPPVLAENPLLGIDGRPQIRIGRFELAEVGGQAVLKGLGAITPGTLVKVTSDRQIGWTASRVNGDVVLPAHDEIVDLHLENPFGAATTDVRLKIVKGEGKDGGCTVELIDGVGQAGQVAQLPADEPVQASSNIDQVTSTERRVVELGAPEVTGLFRLLPDSLRLYYTTENRQDVIRRGLVELDFRPPVGVPEGSIEMRATEHFLTDQKKVVVVVDALEAVGGWVDPDALAPEQRFSDVAVASPNVRFSFSPQRARMDNLNSRIEVRFKDLDGPLLADGYIEWTTRDVNSRQEGSRTPVWVINGFRSVKHAFPGHTDWRRFGYIPMHIDNPSQRMPTG